MNKINVNGIKLDELENILNHNEKTFVIFYADWCPYCVDNIPFVYEYLQKNDVQNCVFVNISDNNIDVWKETGNKKWAIEIVPTYRVYQKNHVLFEHTNVIDKKQLDFILSLLKPYNRDIEFKSSIHAHTKYCNHSDIEPNWLIENARKLKFEQFTISEHISYPRIDKNRPNWNLWPEYVKEFLMLKNNTKDIQIFVAVESEYCKQDHHFYEKYVNQFGLDFMIFGNHNYGSSLNEQRSYSELKDPELMIQKYVEQSIEGMQSNLFFHFAHPDYILSIAKQWNENIKKQMQKIIQCAIDNNISLGFNVCGYFNKQKNNNLYGYPYKKFWEMVANSKAKVRIEYDVHRMHLANNIKINEVYDLAISWKLKKNLIDYISDIEIDKVKKYYK